MSAPCYISGDKKGTKYGREHRKGYQVTMLWSVQEDDTFSKIHV